MTVQLRFAGWLSSEAAVNEKARRTLQGTLSL